MLPGPVTEARLGEGLTYGQMYYPSQPAKKRLTKRQAQVLLFIDACELPPTLREIGDHLGVSSTTGCAYHLERLAAKGWVRFERATEKRQSRGITVLP